MNVLSILSIKPIKPIRSIVSRCSTLSAAFIITLGSCGQSSGNSDAGTRTENVGAVSEPSRQSIALPYHLDSPTVYTLPDELREVSGISFYKGDPATIYAEQDEKGRLYWLTLGTDKIQHYAFGKDGDYEDLAFIAGQAVLLKSNGHLYGFDFVPAVSENAVPVTGELQEWKGLLPKGEYEGMYADTGKNQLYVLCKECKNEDHKKEVSVFLLNKKGEGWERSGSYQISVEQIGALSDGGNTPSKKNSKKISFKPSAISLNPRTHQWYILSSVNKMLVVTSMSWQVQAVYPLDSKMFPQPEGMCFDRDNNLYISNEGPETITGAQQGTVLKFTLQTD